MTALTRPGEEGSKQREEVIRELIRRVKSLIASAVTDGDKGDVVVSGSGAVWTIDSNSISFAKIQDIATSKLLGRSTAGTGDSTHVFTTPLVIYPGEFLSIGFRTLQVTAAVTSGNYVGGLYVNGYWV